MPELKQLHDRITELANQLVLLPSSPLRSKVYGEIVRLWRQEGELIQRLTEKK